MTGNDTNRRNGTGGSNRNTTSNSSAKDRNADPFGLGDEGIDWQSDNNGVIHQRTSRKQGSRPIVRVHTYTDLAGKPVLNIGRTEPKAFVQWLPDGTWSGLPKGTVPPVYRLSEVIGALRSGATIHLPEGEHDADRIAETGAVATCILGGAPGTKAALESLDVLRTYGGAAEVVVWQDKDERESGKPTPGERLSRNVVERLTALGVESIRLVEAKEGKDAADHLDAGHTLDEAVELPLPKVDPDAGLTFHERVNVVLDVLNRIGPVEGGDDDQWEACCPAHDDKRPSLSIGRGADDRPTLHCHAGCEYEEVRSALFDKGVDESVLRGPRKKRDNDPGYMLLSDVTPTRVRWLWPGRIPLGKLTIIDGDPERGKSLLTLDLAARVSSGAEMPDGCEGLREPGGVILTCAEDDIEDTIAPRLQAHGADLSRIATIPLQRDEESGEVLPLTFPEDLGRVRKAVRELKDHRGIGVRLIVVDPVTAFLSESINSHSDASVRRATTPLTEAAQSMGAAVIMVRHLNKQGELKAAYRGGGSIAFTAAARSAIVVDVHPEVAGLLVMARVKNNLAPPVPSLTYRIVPDVEFDQPRIEWLGATDLDADTLLRGKDGRHDAPEREEAERFLRETLADGGVPANEVLKDARGAGITEATLKRAKKSLGIDAIRVRGDDGKTAGWVWRLPEPASVDGVTVKYELRSRKGGR